MIITNVELSEKESARFSDWLNAKKADNVDLQVCVLEALDRVQDDISAGDDPHCELGRGFTQSGNPEVFSFELAEIAIAGEVTVENAPSDD